MQRIPVTHAGSLIRPPELLSSLSAADRGEPHAEAGYAAALRAAVAAVVRRQVDTGIDVIDDGEMGKSNWISYLYQRTTGLEARPLSGDFTSILPASRDRQNFPGAYAEIDALDAAAARKTAGDGDGGAAGPPTGCAPAR
jgi:5-methyltetrahydropteroyltriglutamate--homocysteine methyltransferase